MHFIRLIVNGRPFMWHTFPFVYLCLPDDGAKRGGRVINGGIIFRCFICMDYIANEKHKCFLSRQRMVFFSIPLIHD